MCAEWASLLDRSASSLVSLVRRVDFEKGDCREGHLPIGAWADCIRITCSANAERQREESVLVIVVQLLDRSEAIWSWNSTCSWPSTASSGSPWKVTLICSYMCIWTVCFGNTLLNALTCGKSLDCPLRSSKAQMISLRTALNASVVDWRLRNFHICAEGLSAIVMRINMQADHTWYELGSFVVAVRLLDYYTAGRFYFHWRLIQNWRSMNTSFERTGKYLRKLRYNTNVLYLVPRLDVNNKVESDRY